MTERLHISMPQCEAAEGGAGRKRTQQERAAGAWAMMGARRDLVIARSSRSRSSGPRRGNRDRTVTLTAPTGSEGWRPLRLALAPPPVC